MTMSDVLILGGGVTGLSTAYHLARRGVRRITILEKGPVGDGSSSRAGGIITGLLWSEPGVLARRRALELFRELSDELDGYTFGAVGCLNLFDPASWPDRARLLPLYDRCGAPYEILDTDALRRRWPALRVLVVARSPSGPAKGPSARLRTLGRACSVSTPTPRNPSTVSKKTGTRGASAAALLRRAYRKCSLFHPKALGNHLLGHCVSMQEVSVFSRTCSRKLTAW